MNMFKPYYQKDDITIYHGDCQEILPQLDKVDLVLTDPPYIVGAKGCGLAGNRQYLKDITNKDLDKGFNINMLYQFNNWFCFCGKQQLFDIMNIAKNGNWMLITWNKPNPTPLTNNNYLPDTEYIIHYWQKDRLFGNYKDKSRFIVTPIEQNKYNHPTVKPIRIIEKLIKLGSQQKETILDPFVGIGSTLVAAKLHNRKAIGIEIEEKYCEIATKRLSQEVFQLAK